MNYELPSCTRTPIAGIDFRVAGEGRISLRRLRREDATSDYVSWLNDPEINQFLESRFRQHSIEDLASYIDQMFLSEANLLFGIFLEADQRHIGNIKVGPIDPFHLHASVGLLIGDRLEWGKGYASEAISLLSDFCFEALNLNHLTAGAYAENLGSVKAFERVGYQIEGRLRAHWVTPTHISDGILMGRVNPKLRIAP